MLSSSYHIAIQLELDQEIILICQHSNMVLESYCGHSFWDSDVSWNSAHPVFSPCFSDAGLLWLAAGFLWICSPFAIYQTLKASKGKLPWTLLIFAKLIIILILCASAAYELVEAIFDLKNNENLYPIQYYTPFIKLCTFVLALFLQLLFRRKGVHSSALLFLFWFFTTIESSISYWTLINSIKYPNTQVWTYSDGDVLSKSLEISGSFCLLLLYTFSDTRREKFYNIQNECPVVGSSFFNRLFFFWYDSMAYLGFKKTLTIPDMWTLPENKRCENIEKEFKEYLDANIASESNENHKTSEGKAQINVNILIVLIKAFWPWLMLGALFKFISSVLVFASPQLLDALLTFIVSNQPAWRGYILALGMFSSALFQSLLDSQYEFWIQTTTMKMKSALTATIYNKSLRLSSLGRRDFTTGQIVNLMAVDTSKITDYVNIYNILWSAPLQLVIALYLLWQQIGVASMAGLVVLILLVPINGLLTSIMKKYQIRIMQQKDKRSKLISEIISGMKVLKLYAWEGAFGDFVTFIRNVEIDFLKSQKYLFSGIIFAFSASSFLVTLISFATYVLIDKNNILDANKAFVSISLINIMSIPLAFLPIVLTYGVGFVISIRRINKYLQSDELDETMISHDLNPERPITIRNATFSWSYDEEPVLKKINMEVAKAKLVAVVGTVGSGKSSLLSSLLGDLYKQEGYVNVDGRVAYVPQNAWIQNATVRDNIIFGEPFIKDKYDRVIQACALEPDFKILTGGDQTEIGEKGINLSGGQKQRISIARAVYSNSDVYLLDDPLSAVDAHVAKHLFDQVIGPKGLLKNKTRILVTHRITFLPQVDEIIVLREGKIHENGAYADLMAKKGEFSDFIIQFLAEKSDELEEEDQSLIEAIKETIAPQLEKRKSLVKSDSGSESSLIRRRRQSTFTIEQTKPSISTQNENKPEKDDKFKLVETEIAETGSVKLKVYIEYMKCIGMTSVLLTTILFFVASGFNLGNSLWLKEWSDDALYPNRINDTGLRNKRLGVYAGLGLGDAAMTLANTIVMNLAILNGAALIHEKMLYRLVRAPMSFYDTTPLGRILNRFTKDIDVADNSIGFNLRMLAGQLFRGIISLVVICLETPYLIIVILIMGIAYIFVQRFYIASSRQIRRIEAITRSPIISHFSETVTGTTSIRAYGVSERFTHELYEKVDVNQSTFYPNLGAQRWLAIRLEFLGNIIVTLAAIFAVASRGTVSPGATGLAISYASQITSILNSLVKSFSDVENNVVSIERCLEYTKTPTEAPWVIPSNKLKPGWPKNGLIKFNQYSTRYRPGLDLVLKDIVCTINPNQKVGIVGRTGAGKSSLTLALFRLIEPTNGTIFIDDQDIRDLGLHDLRSRLTVIPQDPVLFSGSFRRNFDPFDLYTDTEIWKALEQAHLKSFVDTLESGLNHEIAEGGENLSVGQRQLVCLTRALLRKTKILVLDEATAAVDVETDQLIQETIRREFKSCTIVTIAHRLNTIMDYDKIIVMDQGKIIEHDTPTNLIANDKSVFHSMAKEAKLI